MGFWGLGFRMGAGFRDLGLYRVLQWKIKWILKPECTISVIINVRGLGLTLAHSL